MLSWYSTLTMNPLPYFIRLIHSGTTYKLLARYYILDSGSAKPC